MKKYIISTMLPAYFLILILFPSDIFSQPTLNPEQTVNTATGEMSFSLPLGVVKGANGNDFPINLNYSAGIHYDSKASDIGLGFGLGHGYIVRRTVLIEDDQRGGEYYSKYWDFDTKDDVTFEEIMSAIFGILVMIVCAVITAVTFGTASEVTVPGMIFAAASFVYTAASTMYGVTYALSSVPFSPVDDYKGGGAQTLSYDYKDLDGVGWHWNKQGGDLPDIYYVSTPFLTGELVWVDDKLEFRKLDGGFDNSSSERKSTVQVNYDPSTMVFDITCADGTRMFFEKTTRFAHEFSIYGKQGKSERYFYWDYRVYFKTCVPTQWHLTKILFSDYVGNENPLEDEGNNIGSWVVFEYDKIEGDIYSYPSYHVENGENSILTQKLCTYNKDEDPVVIQ